MANVSHVLTLDAFPRKEEVGGGYRGRVIDRRTTPSTVYRSDVFADRSDATYWVKSKGHELMAGGHYSLAPLRRADGYYANVWAPC